MGGWDFQEVHFVGTTEGQVHQVGCWGHHQTSPECGNRGKDFSAEGPEALSYFPWLAVPLFTLL